MFSLSKININYNASPEVIFEICIVSTGHDSFFFLIAVVEMVLPLLLLGLNLILRTFLFLSLLNFGGLDLVVFLTLEVGHVLSVILLKIREEFLLRLEGLSYNVLIFFDGELLHKVIFLVGDSSSLHVTGLEEIGSPGKINSYRRLLAPFNRIGLGKLRALSNNLFCQLIVGGDRLFGPQIDVRR